MAGPGNSQDVAARDDAHLRSLGIKPELKRTLGFLSNFAVAFSFISVSTGTFGNRRSRSGVGGVAIFWAWPLVILGQTFVALGFAELASHFPVAGSIYQWSKRLSNRTLGWFTGWFYFWAQVVTVTAVAVIVAFVRRRHPRPRQRSSSPTRSPDPPASTSSSRSSRLVTLLITTLINAFGVRLLSILNNIGVATEILGMVVFALILLFFANHQSPAVLFDSRTAAEAGQTATTSPVVRCSACSWRCSSCTASTPPGRSARRRSTPAARRRAASFRRSGISGIVGAVFLLAVILSFKDIAAAMAEGPGGRVPDRDDDQGRTSRRRCRRHHGRRALPVRHPRRPCSSARWPSRAPPPG